MTVTKPSLKGVKNEINMSSKDRLTMSIRTEMGLEIRYNHVLCEISYL